MNRTEIKKKKKKQKKKKQKKKKQKKKKMVARDSMNMDLITLDDGAIIGGSLSRCRSSGTSFRLPQSMKIIRFPPSPFGFGRWTLPLS